jgi:murein DD-endopeptidase MepM/ murein hydrolase activator NlpD
MPMQMALDALDRIYPPNPDPSKGYQGRPTDAILAKELGPLDPSLVQSVAAGAKAAQTAGAAMAAGPVAAITQPSAANMGGFLSGPYKATYGRADQGRDIQTTPGAPIVAPGDGYVVRIASDPNNDGRPGAHFGPSYPIVHFTSGPYAGQTMYIGHTVAAVKPGQQFTLGAVLSHTGHGGPEAGGAPPGWAEIGFAPGGTPGPFGQKPPF